MPPKNQNPSNSFSIAVMGGGAVGKSCCTLRFVSNKFDHNHLATIEDSFMKQCIIGNEVAYISITDTSGQDEFSLLRDQYYRACDGFLLVYDVTNAATFHEAISLYKEIKLIQCRKEQIPCVLFGNKIDLLQDRISGELNSPLDSSDRKFVPDSDFSRNHSSIVTQSMLQEIKEKLGDDLPIMEGSALLGKNVSEAFHEIVVQIRKERREIERRVLQVKKFQKNPVLSKKRGFSSLSKSEAQDDLEIFRDRA